MVTEPSTTSMSSCWKKGSIFDVKGVESQALITTPYSVSLIHRYPFWAGTSRLSCRSIRARVSTYGQTLDAQLEQLRKARCTKIYREKATGARPDRRELLKMLKALAPGDVVTVTRIDRLARSTFDLFVIVKQIVDAKGQFRSLAEPWADTATSTGRLMIAVLGGLADVERDLIRTRTAEGRSRAKARCQHMDRPPKLTPQQQKEARRPRAQGETLKELAKSYNVGRATISRLA